MKDSKTIKEAIEKLIESKNDIQQRSMFGTDNWGVIDAKVKVLQENMDEDEIIEEFGEEYDEDAVQNDFSIAGIQAMNWMEGELDDDEFF